MRLTQAWKLSGDATKFNAYLDKVLRMDAENEITLDVVKNEAYRYLGMGYG